MHSQMTQEWIGSAHACAALPALESRRGGEASDEEISAAERWDLRLYVVGNDPRSRAVIDKLIRACEERLAGRYSMAIIDAAENPQAAREDNIFAVPMLVRQHPSATLRVIGDFSSEQVLDGLDLPSRNRLRSLPLRTTYP